MGVWGIFSLSISLLLTVAAIPALTYGMSPFKFSICCNQILGRF